MLACVYMHNNYMHKLTAQVLFTESFNDSVRLVIALEILAGSGDGSGIGLGWYGQASGFGGSVLVLWSLK